jgi:hypothetical protein
VRKLSWKVKGDSKESSAILKEFPFLGEFGEYGEFCTHCGKIKGFVVNLMEIVLLLLGFVDVVVRLMESIN